MRTSIKKTRHGYRNAPILGVIPSVDARGNAKKNFLRRNWLTIATAISLVLALMVGLILKFNVSEWYPRDSMYFGFIGRLFLSAIKSIIIPLVLPSIIVAIGSMTLKTAGKLGTGMLLYSLTTTLISVMIGICLVTMIQPGKQANRSNVHKKDMNTHQMTADTLLDVARNMIPSNVIAAMMQTYKTEVIVPKNETIKNTTDIYTWKTGSKMVDNVNMLGLIVWSIVFGIALSVAEAEKKESTVLQFFEGIVDAVMMMTWWIIQLTPLGVFFLVVEAIMKMEDVEGEFKALGLYFSTVLVGLLIHAIIILPSIYFLVIRKNPLAYIYNLAEVLMTAFGTSSSMATLPLTIEASESKNKLDSRVTKFVLPIGATVNMDGTALYEAVAAIYIAQVEGVAVSFGSILAISITATLASVGAAGIPQAGLVTMIIVLSTLGLGSEEIGMILSVDWLLDRFRTAVNVYGDCVGAAVLEKLVLSPPEKKRIDKTRGGASANLGRERLEEAFGGQKRVTNEPTKPKVGDQDLTST